jgi:replicative superfamily II helicase
MVGAIKMIDVMYAKWGYPSETYKVIRKMITYEVGRHLVDLCSIRNIGKVKATQLYAKGITTYRDMLNSSNKEKIENILKKNTADSLEHTREIISDSILSKATNENS